MAQTNPPAAIVGFTNTTWPSLEKYGTVGWLRAHTFPTLYPIPYTLAMVLSVGCGHTPFQS
jgi:hypothetical protein